jgi:clan AA aspartic protease
MISGTVEQREPRIRVKIAGRRGHYEEIDAVVDTGYTGFLTLPAALTAELDLPWKTYTQAIMADGRISSFRVFNAAIIWDGRVRQVPVSKVDAMPLVGMELMTGYELKVEVREGGKVFLKRFPQRRGS